jgi:hypothetical protein
MAILMTMTMMMTICHMMASEGMMIAMLYAIGVYHREGEEGGGRTKYVLPAVGLSIILPVLDKWLVGWVGGLVATMMGLFLPLLKSIVLFVTRENAYLLDG